MVAVELDNLLRSYLAYFITPSALQDVEDLTKIDYTDLQIQKDDQDLNIGVRAEELVSSLHDDGETVIIKNFYRYLFMSFFTHTETKQE